VPTIVAAWDRMRRRLEPIAPDPKLTTAANFLYMRTGEQPIPEAEKALDTYLVLLADHSYNASTFSARVTASTGADIYCAITAAVATLAGDPARRRAEQGHDDARGDRLPEKAEPYVRELLGRGTRRSWAWAIASTRSATRAPLISRRWRRTSPRSRDTKWYVIARALEDASQTVLQEDQARQEDLRQRRVLHGADAVELRHSVRRVHLHVRVRAHGRLVGARARAVHTQPADPAASDVRRSRSAPVRADRQRRAQPATNGNGTATPSTG
jgi:hypothetical protein